MTYIMSEEIKKRIQNIPSFKTDLYKIKNIDTVRSNYGIKPEETIISYRIIPQLFAKLEKGGTIFTDKGVYKRLPSGYLSSDFVTCGVSYEDMVEYIPYLGYSMTNQPQLVGEYTEKNTLSFWLTPVMGTESNNEIVAIFSVIIQEMIRQDSHLSKIYNMTKKKCLTFLEEKFKEGEYIIPEDESILKMLVESNQLKDKQKEDAIFLLFRIRFAAKDYLTAYMVVENNSDYMSNKDFIKRIDPIVRCEIDSIGIPKTYDEVEALKLYCKKNDVYIEVAYSNIVGYYYENGEYEAADEFALEFKDTSIHEKMRIIRNKKIEDIIPIKIKNWSENVDSLSDEKFIWYAINNPVFYKMASKELIEHWCNLAEFEKAFENLEKIRMIDDNKEFLEQLYEVIEKCMILYAEEQYEKAHKYLENSDKELAIQCLRNAVKNNPQKQEYVISLLQTEIDLQQYVLAKNDMRTILGLKNEFDEVTSKKINQLEIKCAEGLNKEMVAFYELLMTDNYQSLMYDPNALLKVDQFGLNFYHYAILLQVDEVVKKVNIKENVINYDLITFGAGNTEVTQTFIELLLRYDGDAIKLKKDYKKQRNMKKAEDLGMSFLNATMSSATKNMDSRLRQMEKENRYASIQDEIVNKRHELKDMSGTMDEKEKKVKNDIEELEEMYKADLEQLANKKIEIYADNLKEYASSDDFESKMIYMIVKNPLLLKDILYGDRDAFELYESSDNFWYLPKNLILAVEKMTMDKVY